MDERSIRKDKELAKAALKGLTVYGGQIARQGNEDEVQQIRRIVDEISGYWGVDGRRDWTGEFDERIREVSQKGNVPQHCSNFMQLKAVKGLYRYNVIYLTRIRILCPNSFFLPVTQIF